MTSIISYEKYRPNYPDILIDRMVDSEILSKKFIVAEVGIGTGKFTDLLFENVNFIYGIEPDLERINFLKSKYKTKENIKLLFDCAENISLNNSTVDVVIAAQSFHMFNVEQAKYEFYRILKPNGTVVLVWYHWDMDYPISSKIRNLFYNYGLSENQCKRVQINDELIEKLFYPNNVIIEKIGSMKQIFSENDFISSMLTSSYATLITNPKRLEDYTNDVVKLVKEFSVDGIIEYSFNIFMYHTKIFQND